MRTPTIPDLTAALERNGCKVFQGKGYDLTLVGLRASPGVVNRFDDLFCVLYRLPDGAWDLLAVPCTTDPGRFWLDNPSRVAGTAILVSGRQLVGAFTFGVHGKGSTAYECLVPTRNLPVWRDGDRDEVLDYGGPEAEGYGIQVHRANPRRTSSSVDKWSAGCQVIANPTDYDAVMRLARLQKANGHGDTFSYAVLDWSG